MLNIDVPVVFEPENMGIDFPRYQTDGASGFDLHADLSSNVYLLPGERCLIPTGLRFEIPPGFELQVRPRSGLALKRGITVVNTPGTVDSDYRGEVKIILLNTGDVQLIIQPNDRVAQGVFAPVVRGMLSHAEFLNESGRGAGGYGSTGR